MAEFGVGLEKEKTLAGKMARLGVAEQDIVESFIRSSKPGGQNVNKVASCVYLKHVPTGIEVKCQEERTQSQNRYRARQILLRRIESAVLGRLSEEQRQREKIRRQKRRRSRRAKAKMLANKHIHSRVKESRRSIRAIDHD
ncbi:MAG TPA: peptide chain release factor-like protein [Candidatus Omnitrophota bacterium]|nr:peptide chain release factor-like protein [Candidatus Omnitrophota bacterium]HQQ05379.1 peptide chain release factor-like protein [Candidatus Omnitrophota bacterium]